MVEATNKINKPVTRADKSHLIVQSVDFSVWSTNNAGFDRLFLGGVVSVAVS